MAEQVRIALLCFLLAAPVQAGQTRRYYTPPLRGRVVYLVPLYPQPTVTRGIGPGINTPPYNPIYRNWSRPRPRATCRPKVTRYTPQAEPVLIINPFCK